MTALTLPASQRQRKHRLLVGILAAITVLWTLTMLASLEWRFLDRFVAGALRGCPGQDFFPVPRGFRNLHQGNSIYLTQLDNYGPAATWYLHHPLVAVALGSWTAALPPAMAFGAFVGASLALLLAAGRVLGSQLGDRRMQAFTCLVLFCSPPTYLMLWNAQPHVLLVLALALILAGLVGLARGETPQWQCVSWVRLGLLISLLTKPAVILMLPVLLALRPTRRVVLLPVVVYVGVSLVFLLLPAWNAGGYNGVHWLNMLNASSSPVISYWLEHPGKLDIGAEVDVYSLPALLYRGLGSPPPAMLLRLPILIALAMSAGPLVLRPRTAARWTIVTVVMLLQTHFLGYYMVWEYHYTSLLPAIPVLFWLWRDERPGLRRRLLGCAFAVLLATLLPTPACLDRELQADGLEKMALWMRVVPVVMSFLCLAGCNLALAREEWLDGRLVDWPLALRRLRSRLPAGMAVVGLLSLLLATVFATVPPRITKDLAQWQPQDWIEHLEDVTSRPARNQGNVAELHVRLARFYTPEQPALARQHLQAALQADPSRADAAAALAALTGK